MQSFQLFRIKPFGWACKAHQQETVTKCFQLFRIKPFGWAYDSLFGAAGAIGLPKVSNYSELNHSVGEKTIFLNAANMRDKCFQLFRIKPFGWALV